MEDTIQDETLAEVNAEISENIEESKNKLKEQDFEIEITDEPKIIEKKPAINDKNYNQSC